MELSKTGWGGRTVGKGKSSGGKKVGEGWAVAEGWAEEEMERTCQKQCPRQLLDLGWGKGFGGELAERLGETLKFIKTEKRDKGMRERSLRTVFDYPSAPSKDLNKDWILKTWFFSYLNVKNMTLFSVWIMCDLALPRYIKCVSLSYGENGTHDFPSIL